MCEMIQTDAVQRTICPDDTLPRCRWVNVRNPQDILYHDTEWGVPSHDDAYLYEMLILEMFVAGLSWACVLSKREAFSQVCAGFDARKVAAFSQEEVSHILNNPAVIRHRGKWEAAVNNSRIYLDIKKEFGSFARYAWGFVENKPVHEMWHDYQTSPQAEALSRDLKRRGMRYVGGVTMYAWMQAVGMIFGHGAECWLHRRI